jgi:molybdate-binding protein
VGSTLRSHLTWVGREPGSGARRCLDQLRPGRPAPERVAYDHRGVAEAIRCGWAEVGVCLRLACEEAGLRFLGIQVEGYDLCYPKRAEGDPRIQGLIRVVRSVTYRRLLGELPGYDASQTGEVEGVVASNAVSATSQAGASDPP